jgi:acetate kinase
LLGLIERIGLEGSVITHKTFVNGETKSKKEQIVIPDHATGLREAARLLTDKEIGVIASPEEINVVGHRVVHGGESFSNTIVITDAVKEKIKSLFPLAPLHNPPNYLGIEVSEQVFKSAKQVAVFDTAFHQTIPPVAYRIAIPNQFYTKHGIRNYGFHGTSHKYVSTKAVEYLKKKDAKLITIHLGNGCSMCAVRNGECIDTSMGFGPMNGLIMGTRTGDIDQSVIFHMVNQLGYTLDEVNNILNKKSGMLGLTGYSDMRDVQTEINNGNKDAALAYEMYGYHIKKYIGTFAAVLNGIDALIFTAGVGENDSITRKLATQQLEYLGINLDHEKNNADSKGIYEINEATAAVKILVVPTNEELEIARQCHSLLSV